MERGAKEERERETRGIATERKIRGRKKTSKEEQLEEEGDCFTGDMIILCSRVI